MKCHFLKIINVKLWRDFFFVFFLSIDETKVCVCGFNFFLEQSTYVEEEYSSAFWNVSLGVKQ
jgi:hypothetical protein